MTKVVQIKEEGIGRVDMSFKSVLEAIGHFPLDVLKLLGSPQGQAVIGITEAAVETWAPAATGAINIFNKFATEAIKVETIGTAAAAGSQTNAQKAAAVIATVGPEALAFAAQNGLEPPTADKLKQMNDLAVQFLNLWVPKSSGTTTATQPVPVSTDVHTTPSSTMTTPVAVKSA